MKKIVITILLLLAMFLLVVVYYAFGRKFARMDARFLNDMKQEYLVQDAKSRIQNYEWFYEQYEVIKSTASKANLSEGAERTSIRMILADQIAEYNSRSKQTMTRALWKSDSLPYQIDEKDFLEE